MRTQERTPPEGGVTGNRRFPASGSARSAATSIRLEILRYGFQSQDLQPQPQPPPQQPPPLPPNDGFELAPCTAKAEICFSTSVALHDGHVITWSSLRTSSSK